jgi:putative ABC transport system permease protein
MFRNYLVTAFRNIARHKLYSFINIAGLAVGLACVILVILFVRDELSYDKWIPGSEDLYRVEMSVAIPGRPVMMMAGVPYPMAAAMREEIPGVTGKTRFFDETMTLTAGDRQFSETVSVVDPEFFTLIRLPLLAGIPGQVFREPESVVLSQSAARKYFGDTDPIGKFISTGRGNCAAADATCRNAAVALKVTGVMRDLPYNTQLTGDVFIPNTSMADRASTDSKQDWLSSGGWSFISLAPGTDPQTVMSRMAPLLDRAVTPAFRKFGIPATGSKIIHVHLTPFAQVHLSSGQWQYNMTPAGSWMTVYGVAVIGLLILLVACFNFMNLATARAQLRAREVALRKCLGAKRRQLMIQFLGESVLTALLALALGLALVEILLPAFAAFLQHPIAFHYLAEWRLLFLIIGIAVAAGLVSGSYPALVLSAFRPAAVLRGNGSGRSGWGRLRAGLVVMQFAVSIGLGIAAAVVFSQISFARAIDLGFRHENIVVVGGGRLTPERREAFVQTLRANPGIADVGLSNMVPFAPDQSLALVQVPGRSGSLTLNDMAVSPGYARVYRIKLLAGRLLSDRRGDDRFNSMSPDGDSLNEGRNLIVNAAGARRLGFTPQEAVGKTIVLNHNHVKIVGVLADTKIDGAREAVKPTAYIYDPHSPLQLSISLKSGAIPQTLAFIDRTWRAFQPSVAIHRYFLDDNFGKLYQADQRQGTMFAAFVGIAIFIACLGLFGLAAFTAGRRTKEIGIRKVFGARTRNVVMLLLWQFSIPVLVANAIAWPLAWYYLHGWLQGFAYRIALSPLYFVAAGLIALAIAWATVFAHALRVARANPIHALRTE